MSSYLALLIDKNVITGLEGISWRSKYLGCNRMINSPYQLQTDMPKEMRALTPTATKWQ